MQEKWDRAKQLIDEGQMNREVLDTLKAEFGSGVSTAKLAEWRAEQPQRTAALTAALAAARREERAEKVRAKRALCKEMLNAGASGYACVQACKEQYGSGVGYETLQELQAELAAEGASVPKGAIVPVDLPPEMIVAEEHEPEQEPEQEPEPEPELEPEAPATDLVLTRPPEPNGTLVNIKAIQRWMGAINAESLHLTRDGRLSVLARHEFNLGGIE